MRIYVAGASAEIDRAEAFVAKLREHGITVTSEWPESVRKAGSANRGLDHETRAAAARDCMSSVAISDWLVVLEPEGDVHTIGAWAEFGFAHARGIETLWVGDGDCTIMSALADYQARDDENALHYLIGVAADNAARAREMAAIDAMATRAKEAGRE